MVCPSKALYLGTNFSLAYWPFLDSPLENHVGAYPYKIVELIFVVHFPEIKEYCYLPSVSYAFVNVIVCGTSLGFRCKKSGMIAQ